MATYDYDDIKEAEKQKLKAAEAELDAAMLRAQQLKSNGGGWAVKEEGKTAVFSFDQMQLILGIALITIGVLAFTSQLEIWRYWWLIFFAKPLLFGWGKKRGHWC